MKKEKVLLIILAFLVVLGGVLFFTRDDKREVSDNSDGVIVGEEDEDIDKPKDQEFIAGEDEAEDEGESTETTAEIARDKPAPDFTLTNLDGESVSLSDYQGRIVLLNFWATWCGFCDKEMPDLKRLNAEYEDVVVLAVDVMEEEGIVREYIDKGGYDFDVVLDLDGEVAKTYLVSAFPTSYFIEEDGTLIGAVSGMLEYDQMVKIIENIKAER